LVQLKPGPLGGDVMVGRVVVSALALASVLVGVFSFLGYPPVEVDGIPGLSWESDALLPRYIEEAGGSILQEDTTSRVAAASKLVNAKIFTAEETARDAARAAWFADRRAPYWTPAIEQIRLIEEHLPQYLWNHWPSCLFAEYEPLTFFRQYSGYTIGGSRVILINAACEGADKTTDYLVWPDDGDPCHFRLEYHLNEEAFCRLDIQGGGSCSEVREVRRITQRCS